MLNAYANYATYNIIVHMTFQKSSSICNTINILHTRMQRPSDYIIVALVISHCHMLQNQQSQKYLLCTVMS